jgi:hypothetical protein
MSPGRALPQDVDEDVDVDFEAFVPGQVSEVGQRHATAVYRGQFVSVDHVGRDPRGASRARLLCPASDGDDVVPKDTASIVSGPSLADAPSFRTDGGPVVTEPDGRSSAGVDFPALTDVSVVSSP